MGTKRQNKKATSLAEAVVFAHCQRKRVSFRLLRPMIDEAKVRANKKGQTLTDIFEEAMELHLNYLNDLDLENGRTGK